MIHQTFSIYDAKAEAFLPPFILPKMEMAKRIFSDAVNSPAHQFGKNPEDYTLFCLGTFDDSSGQFLLQRTPQSLGLGVEYVRTTDVMAMEGLSHAETNGTLAPPISDGASIQPGTSSDDPTE